MLLCSLYMFAGRTLPAGPNTGQKLVLSPDSAVRIGVANSFVLQSIDYRQAAVKELITERWRAYLPSLGLSFDRSRTIADSETDIISNEIRVTIEQVIYDGGQRGLDLDLAKIDGLLTKEDFRITYNQLRLDIQSAYLQALAAYGKIQLNLASLARAHEQLRQAQLEERLGFGTRVQVLTVAARLREIELSVERARNEYRQSLHQLKLAMNLDFEIDLELEGNLFYDYFLKPPDVDRDLLVQRARSLRPEYKRSIAGVHRLKKEKEIAENAWIPQVSVGGYVGREGEKFPLRDDTWGVNFRVTFPLGPHTTSTSSNADVSNEGQSRTGSTNSNVQFFDDLSYDRRILESKTALADALSQHNQLNNQLAIEVDSAYDDLRESWESIRIGNGRVYFQYASIRILGTSYEAGQVRRADVLESEVELVQAQEDLTDAIAAYIIASYELEFAAALDPGSLDLFRYGRNKGNTLPGKILDGDLEDIEAEGKEDLNVEELRRLYLDEESEQERREEIPDGEVQGFEIEKVELD